MIDRLLNPPHVVDERDFEDWQGFLDAQGREHREALFELVRSFGEDFVDFVCAHAGKWSLVGTVPSNEQRTVVAEVYEIAANLATIADPNHRRVATARKLNCYVDEIGTTRTMEWHRRCGGRVEPIEDDGSLEYAIKILARDLVGNRLLEPGTHPNVVLEKHPMYRELFARLEDNEPLRSIFQNVSQPATDQDSTGTVRSHEVLSALLPLWSDGTSQTLQFHEAIQALLTNTIVPKYAPNDVVEIVQQCAIQQLQKARRISQGERVIVPTLVGLTGVKLAEDVEKTGLERMLLRRSTPLDPGCLNGTTQIWSIAEIDTEFYYLHNNKQDDTSSPSSFPRVSGREPDHSAALHGFRSQLSNDIDRFCLALLLCSGEEALAINEVYRLAANPMVSIAALRPSGISHNIDCHEMTSNECMDFEDWVEIVSRMPDHLNAPMRRLLRAARRTLSVERLLDAVTTWDALLGSYPESIPPTVAQIALLLEPADPVARSTLESELGQIYGIRADIVYAVSDPYDDDADLERAASCADAALSIAIEIFRRIIDSSVLAAQPDARSRSRALAHL